MPFPDEDRPAMLDKPPQDPKFEALLEHIQENRGFDFRGYKRASLRRRIALRMSAIGASSFDEYQANLEADPREIDALIDTVLINVTSFFRDPEAWDVLKTDLLPQLIANADRDQPIRIWSVGCATGQEPYSIAMLLAEQMGITEFCERVKIYATDLDEEALKRARAAQYTAHEVESVPPDYLERYFKHSNGHYLLRRELRKCVIFGRHNVVSDVPISRIDLIACRNLLIYLESDAQEAVLSRFHYALGNDGCLFLGKAETQLARSQAFRPTDVRHRIFAKVPQGWQLRALPSYSGRRADPIHADVALLSAVIDATSDAMLAIDDLGSVMLANAASRRLLGITAGDIGRPFQDLVISYRPIELRGPIEEAFRHERLVTLEDQEFRLNQTEVFRLTIKVRPLPGFSAVLLCFTDNARLHLMQQELENAHASLEQSVEQLQSANEELETTNEELQSANEELETTNEELQSTNEELETLNEEARSSNDEMEAVNEELSAQAQQASDYRNYLEAILRAMNGGIIAINARHRIRSWNKWSETTWGLRAEEVIDSSFEALDIGVPLEALATGMAEVEKGRRECVEQIIEGVNRRGRRIVCRVKIMPLLDDNTPDQGLVMMFQDITDGPALAADQD